MNPLIKQQLKRVNDLVEDLRDTLNETRGDLKEKQDAYVGLTKEYWERGSKIAVLDQNDTEFDALQEENGRLKDQQRACRERLEKVLTFTKALSAEFRP